MYVGFTVYSMDIAVNWELPYEEVNIEEKYHKTFHLLQMNRSCKKTMTGLLACMTLSSVQSPPSAKLILTRRAKVQV